MSVVVAVVDVVVKTLLQVSEDVVPSFREWVEILFGLESID